MKKAKPRKQTTYELEYVVEGTGEFPYDMLRYDCSYPHDEPDSHAIRREYESTRRRVRLRQRSLNTNGPNIARWRSFSWRVVEIEGDPV
jgi:hypothetical protein